MTMAISAATIAARWASSIAGADVSPTLKEKQLLPVHRESLSMCSTLPQNLNDMSGRYKGDGGFAPVPGRISHLRIPFTSSEKHSGKGEEEAAVRTLLLRREGKMRMVPKESDHAFETAFGVRHPWQLSSIAISKSKMLFEVVFDYHSSDAETCPFCGATLMDLFFSTKKSWSHINFFEYETRMTACLPVFRCSNSKCAASVDREAILNALFLDVLLMVSHSGANSALETLLTTTANETGQELPTA